MARARTTLFTHIGRKSGKPYQVKIWFVVDGDRIILGTANIERQWVRNVQKTPQVKLAIAGDTFEGIARFLSDPAEHERAMSRIQAKYWIFYPLHRLGDLLIRMGLVRTRSGAFEVALGKD